MPVQNMFSDQVATSFIYKKKLKLFDALLIFKQ